MRSRTRRLCCTKAASSRYRTTRGKASPRIALATRVSMANASIPRYSRTRGQRRTSRPGEGIRRWEVELLVAVVAAGGCGKLAFWLIEDEHRGRSPAVTEGERPVYTHGHEEERQVQQAVAVHPPGHRNGHAAAHQVYAIPQQPGPKQCRRHSVEHPQCSKERRHQGKGQENEGISQHLEGGSPLPMNLRK